MRIVFSIIHNGIHHLHHNNQYNRILSSCDKWVVVEGASRSNGSTKWCKDFPDDLHVNGGSNDGTREFLKYHSNTNEKLIYIPSNGFWQSKDHQVNRAIEEVKKITDRCWLWEIDIDEQWEPEQMDAAENELFDSGAKAGCFRANCFVGRNLRAIGDWGEAFSSGYIRLWKWEGENFICHEPPIIEGQMGIEPTMLSQVFRHYNYYFDKDVIFKDRWYGGHEQIFERWKLINSLGKNFFPMHISNLITGPWGNSNSSIIYVEPNGKKKLIQIGANRGYDHVFEITKHNKHECILVEPNKYLIDSLKDCYKNCDNITIENCAISTFDGSVDMYFNDMKEGDSSHSSLSLSHVLDHNNKKENIIKSNVPCMKLESLIQKYNWINEEIEWLFIDAEGHDCDIILSTDFSKFNIKNVFFETIHSDGSFKNGQKLQKTIDYLMSFGYVINAKKITDESNLTLSKI
jgi:FkbM family methyltransferase